MGTVIGRSLTASGAYLIERAKRMAQNLLRFKTRSKTMAIDGYLIRATRNGNTAIGVVMDPPGQLILFGSLLDSRGRAYPVGSRDMFDSRTGMMNGPFGYEDITPVNDQTEFVGLGFDPNETNPSSAWNRAFLWRDLIPTNKDLLRTHSLRVAGPEGVGYPYDTYDQVPNGSQVFSGVVTRPKVRASVGYWWAEAAIEDHAPGYQLMCRTDLGYMTFQYQGMQPCSAYAGDGWTLMAIPVVKNLDPGEAVHWGHSGILFALLNYEKSVEDGVSTVFWSRLWLPDEHSVDFFHNGPWVAEPSSPIGSPFTNPQESWSTFWENWSSGSKPLPAGGSRPNWTDAMSMCWFNGRFVVNVRLCALNAALSDFGLGWDYSYIDAGGSAHMRFEIDLDGGFEAQEVQHEVWDCVADYPDRKRPYDVWVAGILDEDVVYGVNPLATFPMPNGLVEVRWRMEAERVGLYNLGNGPFFAADLSSGRLEFTITKLDAEGNEIAPVVREVFFEELGAGIQGPTTGLFSIGEMHIMFPPTSSYKLWSMNPMFVALSDHEIGFVCYEQWQDFSPDLPSAVKLGVLNTETGVAEVRSELGFMHDPKLQYERQIHLNCMQRTIYDEEGEVIVEGVLFVSGEPITAVLISRDSGRTWQEYLTFPQPLAGAYYLANPLMPPNRAGSAVMKE